MAKRYSRIRQGARYEAARVALKAYEDAAGTRPRRLNTRGNYDYIPVYVYPFGTALGATTERVKGRAQSTHYDLLSPFINTAVGADSVSNALGTNKVVPLSGFTPARVIWQRAATKNKTTPTAEATQQEYLKYEDVNRFSCPFGRSAATDRMLDVFLQLKALLQGETFAVNRVALKEENITYKAS